MSQGGKVGLVLAGGGARGAYEIGVLSVLLPALEARGERPTVIVGTSVGAINAAYLASKADVGAHQTMGGARELWESIALHQVIRPMIGPQALVSGLRYLGESFNVPGVNLYSLLDSTPLSDKLNSAIEWHGIRRNVSSGKLDAVGIVATSAAASRSVVFMDGAPVPEFDRSRGIEYVHTRLGVDHVRASAAIPVVFPAVEVSEPDTANGWYFDGGTRLNTPIKPAIKMGIDRVVVVGLSSVADGPPHERDRRPDFADGALQLLHAVLVDPLVHDIQSLGTRNELLAAVPDQSQGSYRQIPYVFVAPEPANDFGAIASEIYRDHYRLPRRDLGALDLTVLGRLVDGGDPMHGELLSYLFFAREFVDALISLGREDAHRYLDQADDPWRLEPIA